MNKSKANLIDFYRLTLVYLPSRGAKAGTGAWAKLGAWETADIRVLVSLPLIKASPASLFLPAGREL